MVDSFINSFAEEFRVVVEQVGATVLVDTLNAYFGAFAASALAWGQLALLVGLIGGVILIACMIVFG